MQLIQPNPPNPYNPLELNIDNIADYICSFYNQSLSNIEVFGEFRGIWDSLPNIKIRAISMI